MEVLRRDARGQSATGGDRLSSPGGERYARRLEEVDEIASALSSLLAGYGLACREAAAEIHAGRPAHEMALRLSQAGMANTRRAVHDAMGDLSHAMQILRGTAIRLLVDGGYLTITDVARLGEISVQMARRLYRAVPPL